jgi:hypothetical protein
MPDLYLGVVCSECLATHDLYNGDSFSHARGNSYTYTCPANGRRVVVRVNFPDAAGTAVPVAGRPANSSGGRLPARGDRIRAGHYFRTIPTIRGRAGLRCTRVGFAI